uniref:Uncharacterized protein n=1 Tax=Chromera velia CCMP2878 TaxID=1169474 RepID=A0A0G4I009_9ALVE|eukprot:Cvel_1601.t1-p1 / transcript=Cvel_1601.t1 / gene=Cvel_1601 / organism=Chromera_velia_CCMP2878 / gene_product=hypothetical protein / transcript_product=hypothetical protein / location=Cvel_scaffold57:76493-77754(+) / protein_length=120 / sequence_SO=supercontig / SO=protein_coding / is_pseudo=false
MVLTVFGCLPSDSQLDEAAIREIFFQETGWVVLSVEPAGRKRLPGKFLVKVEARGDALADSVAEKLKTALSAERVEKAHVHRGVGAARRASVAGISVAGAGEGGAAAVVVERSGFGDEGK